MQILESGQVYIHVGAGVYGRRKHEYRLRFTLRCKYTDLGIGIDRNRQKIRVETDAKREMHTCIGRNLDRYIDS